MRATAPEPRPFTGVRCETVATGTLLRALGYELSEHAERWCGVDEEG